MAVWPESYSVVSSGRNPADVLGQTTTYAEAEAVLEDLARVFFENTNVLAAQRPHTAAISAPKIDTHVPNLEAKYRALVEQIPAVVFMAYLDEGVGEAYVSPQIEAVLGFTQEEWLQDPVRWYSASSSRR